MSKIYRLVSPFIEELDFLEINDVVYLSGVVITARDQAHKRIVIDQILPPVSIKNLALWHAGPVVIRKDNEWKIISIGSTTSTRIEPLLTEFIEKTGIKMIIGKGFLSKKIVEVCRKHKCIAALYPGGLGALGAKAVKKVVEVHWLDLGIPEALWVLEVENLGPLIITIDIHGNIITTQHQLNSSKF